MNVGIVRTGSVGKVGVQAQALVEECGLGGHGVLRLAVGVSTVAAAVEDITYRIHAAVGQGAVGVDDGRAGVPFVGNVTPDVATGLALGLRHHVLAVSDVGVGCDLEPGSNLVAHLHTAVVHLVGVGVHLAVEQTVVVVESGRDIVIEFVVRSRDGQVVGLGEGKVLVQGVVVIGSFMEIQPAAFGDKGAVGNQGFVIPAFMPQAIFVEPCRGKVHGLVDGGRITALVVVPCLVEVLGPHITV